MNINQNLSPVPTNTLPGICGWKQKLDGEDLSTSNNWIHNLHVKATKLERRFTQPPSHGTSPARWCRFPHSGMRIMWKKPTSALSKSGMLCHSSASLGQQMPLHLQKECPYALHSEPAQVTILPQCGAMFWGPMSAWLWCPLPAPLLALPEPDRIHICQNQRWSACQLILSCEELVAAIGAAKCCVTAGFGTWCTGIPSVILHHSPGVVSGSGLCANIIVCCTHTIQRKQNSSKLWREKLTVPLIFQDWIGEHTL